MAGRDAACSCGQLRVRAEGDPFVVSICHCLSCQRRTGSAFGMQAGFRADQVQVDRPLRRLRPDVGRAGPQGPRLPLLPGLRRNGVLHGARRGRPGGGHGRHLRGPGVPTADRVGLRGAAAPVVRSARGHRQRRGVGSASAALRGGRVRRRWRTAGERLSRNIPSIPRCSTTSPAARAWPGGRAMPSSTSEPRSTSDEEFRPMAAEDSDFDPIRDQPAFSDLVGEPGATGRAPSATTPSRESTSSTVSGTAASAQPRRS